MNAKGSVFKYPDNVDTDVIIPARYLNSQDAKELAQHCQLRAVEESRVVLCLAQAHAHLLGMRPVVDKLQQALCDYFSRPLKLVVEQEAAIGDTPATLAQRQKRERQEQAVASLEKDEFVREAIELFDATLIVTSIKPL